MFGPSPTRNETEKARRRLERERLIQQMIAQVVDAAIEVGQHDDADPAHWIEADERAVATGAAVVPDDIPDGAGQDVPR